MAYSVDWNEALPAGTSAAGILWQFIQNDKIAVRERIDSIFGTTGGAQSLDTADPYLPYLLLLSGTPASRIVPGSTSLSLRDTANAADNLLVLDNGNTTVRGSFTSSKRASGARIVVNASATTVIDLSLANSIKLELDIAITTLTLQNPVAGTFYLLEIVQSGGFTITWPASIKWTNAVAPVLTVTAGRIDIISLYYNGTDYMAVVAGQNFTPT